MDVVKENPERKQLEEGDETSSINLLRGDVSVPDGEADEAKETRIRAGLRRCWVSIFKYSNCSQ